MDRGVAGNNVTAVQRLVARGEVRHETAGLADQQHAGGDIPQAQPLFPEAIEAAGSHPGKVERGGPVAAHARADRHDFGKLLQKGVMVLATAAAKKRNARAEQRIRHRTSAGYAQTPFVQEGALAAFGEIELVLHRVEDRSGGDHLASLCVGFHHRDGNGEMRDAVKEVGCAVQRIDNPDRRVRVVAFNDTAFLQHETPVRTCLGQLLADRLFRIDVGAADKIRRPLAADLKILDLAEIAEHAAAGVGGRLLHDVDQR